MISTPASFAIPFSLPKPAAWLGMGCAVLVLGAGLAGAQEPAPRFQPGGELFTNGAVSHIRIEMSVAGVESLRRDPRTYVSAIIHEGTHDYPGVEVHLKGASSFRSIDDKPGLTLSFGGATGAPLFHGLQKIHLNNSVEDPSFMNEQLGHDLFRAAGVPAPRVAYALVELNGRKLGLYVLKEGFTEDLLAGYFAKTGGNIYEAEFGHDVDRTMKRNSGRQSKRDQTDRQALAAAAAEPDAGKRWQRLAEVLDVDQFLTFMMTEVVICHRDGYSLARNNFRVYHDLDTDKMRFFPHGMDQLFGKSDFPWNPHMAGMVAAAVMDTPEGRQRYAERFPILFEQIFQVEKLSQRVDELVQQLKPSLARSEFTDVQREAALVKERIVQRHASLKQQLSQPGTPALNFADGVAHLAGWQMNDRPAHGKMDQPRTVDNVPALHISAEAASSASWRTKARLPRGYYQFAGRIMIAGVKPLSYGKHQGAGLRISTVSQTASDFVGDSAWRTMRADFQIEADSEEVEFVCELRASTGEAWFDANSLCVKRISPPTLSARNGTQ